MVRRQPARDMQMISANRQMVAACISKQLRATTPDYYDVVEGADFIQLKFGDTTLRLYDIADAVGGTMVTIYVGSPMHVAEGLSVVGYCRTLLEPPKPTSEGQAK